MDIDKIQYYENIESPKHREYIDSQVHCILCGSALEMQHIVLDGEEKIREEAYCSHCQTRTRAKEHGIQ